MLCLRISLFAFRCSAPPAAACCSMRLDEHAARGSSLTCGACFAPQPCAGNDGTYLFNTYTGQWKQGRPRPYAGHHIAAEVINNKLYLFAGLRSGSNKVSLCGSGEWMGGL